MVALIIRKPGEIVRSLMSEDTKHPSIDERTTKLKKAESIVEDNDNANGIEKQQTITFAATPQEELPPSNGHLPKTPAYIAATSQSMMLEAIEPKKVSKQAAKKASGQQPQLQPHKSEKVAEEASALRIRCKQICVSTFLRGHSPVRSLGFTSAIHGEGKSFLARLAAEVMAEDDSTPVTLLECNWEHPSLDTAFHLAPGSGLAEWLSGYCDLAAIRHQVSRNLTVIPAGDSKDNPVGLLRAFQRRGALKALTQPNELLIIDLPSIMTTAYGQLAAELVDSVILVVHMGVTPESFVTDAEHLLENLPVQGIVFNQVASRVPKWLRRLL
jgi:Mrp family chromosome partitioning ATPase